MFDDLSRYEVDKQHPVIQMLDSELTTTKSSQQIDLDLCIKLILISLEPIMRLLLNHYNDISTLRVRCLITLAMECNMRAVLHALVDMHFELLLLRHDFLSKTDFTPVLWINLLATAIAIVTSALELLDHRTHLPYCRFYTSTLTSCTLPDRTLFHATFTMTF